MDGYEHQEIAKILNCCVGNSKSQLYKAKLRIREFLAKPAKSEDVTVQLQKVVQEQAPSRLRKMENVDVAMIQAWQSYLYPTHQGLCLSDSRVTTLATLPYSAQDNIVKVRSNKRAFDMTARLFAGEPAAGSSSFVFAYE